MFFGTFLLDNFFHNNKQFLILISPTTYSFAGCQEPRESEGNDEAHR